MVPRRKIQDYRTFNVNEVTENIQNIKHKMWSKGSKPIACRFLDIKPEEKIGERGFQDSNSLV